LARIAQTGTRKMCKNSEPRPPQVVF
jgi:hypothetical protein